MTLVLICVAAVLPAQPLFETKSFEAAGPIERVIPVGLTSSDKAAALLIQSGALLQFLPREGEPFGVDLPQGTSAYDVYDVDADGSAELIAVLGKEIISIPLTPGTSPHPYAVLFEKESVWSEAPHQPFPAVLAQRRDESAVIVLPIDDTMQYFQPDDSAIPDSAASVTFDDQVQLDALARPFFSPPGIDEWSLSRKRSAMPEASTSDVAHSVYRDSESFVWRRAAIEKAGTPAHFALIREGDADNTLVRIEVESVADPISSRVGKSVGPVRVYPGRTVEGAVRLRPDFDGDGYSDLLLWDTSKPALSVDSLLRTATSSSWPLTLSVHVYAADAQRFRPQSSGRVTIEVPVGNFLVGAPLHDVLLHDFNGDGCADLGVGISPSDWRVWTFENGFTSKPNGTIALPSDDYQLEIAADLDGSGRTSLVFANERSVIALYASAGGK